MKNKIFLTSMLAVMVAGPAFATTLGPGESQPYTEDCEGAPIDNVTAAGSTVRYTAQWTPDECTISLDANGGSGGTDTLYTKFGVGAYLTSAGRTANTNLMTSAANSITAPTGATVTTTYDTNAPTNGRTGQQYSLTPVSPSTPTKAFAGFWSTNAATGGYKYISETSPYYITGDTTTANTGAYVAADIAKEDNNGSCPSVTWYARWDCATRTIAADYTGTLTGWETDGKWYTASTGGSVESNTCTTSDQTLYLHWTPKTYTVTYDCDGGTGGFADTDGATYDTGYTFAAVGICTKTGSTQSGWDCKTDDTVPVTISQSDNTTAWQVDDDVTCTAVYGANQITLKWYVDEENVTDSLQNSPTCNYGTANGITVNDPTPARGYSFAGWEVVGTNGQ